MDLSSPTLTDARNYDVFAYLDSGTLALERLIWTDATNRATAVTYQDGRLCKSGDKTRLLLGTFRASGGTTTRCDSGFQLVSNVYNRRPRYNVKADTTSTWTQNSASWRAARADSSNAIFYVETMPSDSADAVDALVCASGYLSSGAAIVAAAVGVDSTSLPSGLYGGPVTSAGATLYGGYCGRPGTGFHTLYWLEYGSASVMNWYGDNTVSTKAGIKAIIQG